MIKTIYKTKILAILVALTVMTCCTSRQGSSVTDDGYNYADSIVSNIGDERDFVRLIQVTDSFEQAAELTQVKAIFYKSIAYNLMGQHRSALHLYYQLASIDIKKLETQADLECYIYSYKDYVRLLCDMRRYDRALRETYNADSKLKAVGYNTFTTHQDIAQMMGESQLYLAQTNQAIKSFEKSLQAMQKRLSTYNNPLDMRECQKTMNAIALVLINRRLYREAIPWVQRQDSLFTIADKHPRRDSVFVDEMKAEISYSKALLAHAQGRNIDAERAYAEYQSTQTAKLLECIIRSSEYLMLTHRYDEAARNYTQLDQFLIESGYKADLENIGRYMIPKYRANLLAGNRDTAIAVATKIADYYNTALERQKISDADLLSTIYDTEGKERQIAEQHAKLSQQRLLYLAIVAVIIIIFFHIYIIQRRKAFRKLSATNQQLMKANERAEESNRMKTKFIQQISHEVRTPLNVLSGFSQVLATPDIEIDGNELQSISQKIVENSDRITKLVDKMLDLSMVNSDTDIECCDTLTPAEVATLAVSQSGIQQINHLDFQLQVSPETNSMTFITNRKSAVKALALLLDNAIKFTHPLAFKGRQTKHPKAHVTLSVSSTLKKVVFMVEDTGIGIPVEQTERIFDEFVQLDDYSDGTGIGLSIARSLARHMQGDIILDTSYTTGARFIMSLPLFYNYSDTNTMKKTMKQMAKTVFLSLMLMAGSTMVYAQQHYENRGFKAMMNGKIPVEVMYQTTHNANDEWMTAGFLYYPKAKNPAPILIVEGWYPEKPIQSEDENETVSRFVEYQPDGEKTGTLYVTYVEVEGDFQMRRASWKNPTTGRILQLSNFEEMRELPSWYPGPPAVLSAPGRIEWQTKERVYSSEGPNSEWLDKIEVDFLKQGKKMFTVKEDLSGAISKDLLSKDWGWVTHEDINFDGFPDVLIYVGMQPNGNRLHKAYVWNSYTRQFYPVPEFDEIQEPDFDKKAKTITSRARDYQNVYISTFKWKNGKLKRVSSKTLPLH